MTGFLDTNILIYALDRGAADGEIALGLIGPANRIAVQSLNEFAHVCSRKLRMDWPKIQLGLSAVLALSAAPPIPLTFEIHTQGLWLAERYQLAVYDALLIAAALSGDCDIFWSEDLHDGLVIDGRLTIRNPFV